VSALILRMKHTCLSPELQAVTSALILCLKKLCETPDFGFVGGRGVFYDDTGRFSSSKVRDPSDPGDPLCSSGLAGVVVICDTAGYIVEVVA